MYIIGIWSVYAVLLRILTTWSEMYIDITRIAYPPRNSRSSGHRCTLNVYWKFRDLDHSCTIASQSTKDTFDILWCSWYILWCSWYVPCIAASPACRAAKAGIRTIQVEARAGDVMAGAGGAAGPAPDVRHQPQGDVLRTMQNHTYWYRAQTHICINARGAVVSAALQFAWDREFKSWGYTLFCKFVFSRKTW